MSTHDHVRLRATGRPGEAEAIGRPLDAAVRSAAEQALGHDFSSVRVHADGAAARAAQAEGAAAYSLGGHVVFGAGAYAPGTPDGDRLLAHELAHVAQQRGGHAPGAGRPAGTQAAEREADAAAAHVAGRRPGRAPLSRTPRGMHRAPAPRAPAPSPQTAAPDTPRGHFEHWLSFRFPGVRVVEGGQERQTREVFSRRVNGRPTTIPAAQQRLPNWQPWDEARAAAIYDHAIDAIEDVAGVFGGAPNITEVLLYATEYTLTATGAVPNGNVGASFGAGQLTLYAAGTTMAKWLPVARSTASGRYPSVVIGVSGVTGQSPGAPLPYPTREQSDRRVIAHELGHGIAEAAHAADPQVFTLWNRAVGWHNDSLYDVQAPGVTAALAAGTAPPAAALITPDDWNSPRHGEQPLTDYAVKGGPGEDFAESVMGLVYAPELLRSRSPARHAFLQARRTTLVQQLVPLPPVGDFPTPKGDTRVA